jgi:hypothetical protein
VSAPSSWHPRTLVVRVWDANMATEFAREVDARGRGFRDEVNMDIYYQMFSDVIRVKRAAWHPYEVGVYILNGVLGRRGTGTSKMVVKDCLASRKGFFLDPEPEDEDL